jgi:hypothetical protein
MEILKDNGITEFSSSSQNVYTYSIYNRKPKGEGMKRMGTKKLSNFVESYLHR